MELNDTKIKQLNAALMSAYPVRSELKRMLRFQMNEKLDLIAPTEDLPETVIHLTKWAETQGRLDELILKAYYANPANRQLYDFVQHYEEEKDREEPGFKTKK